MPYFKPYSLLALVLFYWSFSSVAQNYPLIDSLKLAYSQAKVDSAKARIAMDLGGFYISSYVDTGFVWANRAAEHKQGLKDPSLDASLSGLYGVLYMLKGERYTSIKHFQSSLDLYEELGDMDQVGRTLLNMSILEGELGNNEKCINNLNQCLEYTIPSENWYVSSYAVANLIGQALLDEDPEEAIKQIHRLEEISAKQEEFLCIDQFYGEYYNQIEDFAQAKSHLTMALANEKFVIEKNFQLEIKAQLAFAEAKLGNHAYAKELMDWSISHIENTYQEAFFTNVFDLAHEVYKAGGKYEKALNYKNQYLAITDSVDQLTQHNTLAELSARYESEKKEKELSKLEKINQQNEARSNLIIWISVLLVAAASIIAWLQFRNVNKRKRANELLSAQHAEILKQRQSIISSITYAQRIQNSLLPSREELAEKLDDMLIFYQPKDIVSGDFYWFSEIGDKLVLAAADCTGHGVPGAFMSLISHNALNVIVNERGILDPGEILRLLNIEICTQLNHKGGGMHTKEGLDLSLCVIDKQSSTMKYAGAINSMLHVTNQTLTELESAKYSIGSAGLPKMVEENVFETRELQFAKGDFLYMYTDGFVDQFGAEKNRKLNKTRFKELISSLSHFDSMAAAEEKVKKYFHEWKGSLKQIDDVLVIGVRL